MSDHYYSRNPQSSHITQTWKNELLGHSFTFTSGAGVFSKQSIDYGTRLLIETFVNPTVKGNILDLGCGYGPIGISLARQLSDRQVVMVDVNERAVLLAKENAAENGVQNVEIMQSDGFTNLVNQSFAAILTNPPIRAGKELIFEFFKQSEVSLVAGGELWIVIQKKQGAPSTIRFLETLFTEVEVVQKQKGYFIIRARKD